MRRYVCFQLMCLSFFISSSTVVAEEMLVKGEAKYIGWQTPKLKFTTCYQYEMEIGDGKIEKTSEKCQKAPSGPSPLVIVGTVVDVHAENETFEIEDKKGQRQDLFYRETIGTKVKLRNLKKGDKLIVTSPIKGRAEVIEVAVTFSTAVTFNAKADVLHVPQEIALVYVYLQKPGTLEYGSSELFGRVSRNEFIKKFEEYVKIAKSKQMKLIVRASTADEKNGLKEKSNTMTSF